MVALARPVRIATLATALGVDPTAVKAFAARLALGVELVNDATQFRDEDFETYVRDRVNPADIATAHHRLADISSPPGLRTLMQLRTSPTTCSTPTASTNCCCLCLTRTRREAASARNEVRQAELLKSREPTPAFAAFCVLMPEFAERARPA